MILVLGISGVVLILAAFIMNLLGRCTVTDRDYLLVNIVGCIFASTYCALIEAYPIMVLQIIWGVSATCKLLTTWRKCAPEKT